MLERKGCILFMEPVHKAAWWLYLEHCAAVFTVSLWDFFQPGFVNGFFLSIKQRYKTTTRDDPSLCGAPIPSFIVYFNNLLT